MSLLEKELGCNSVRVALERERPVLQIRKQETSHGVVEIEEVALVVTLGRIKTLFR